MNLNFSEIKHRAHASTRLLLGFQIPRNEQLNQSNLLGLRIPRNLIAVPTPNMMVAGPLLQVVLVLGM